MAKSVLNSGLEQVRGKISDWVYKVVRGKRVIARRPVPNPNAVPSQSQMEVRERFTDAAAFARSMLGNPPDRAFYNQLAQALDKPIMAVLVADFFSKPKVHAIVTDAYHGHVGEKIVVRASDYDVRSVTVTIRDNVTQ